MRKESYIPGFCGAFQLLSRDLPTRRLPFASEKSRISVEAVFNRLHEPHHSHFYSTRHFIHHHFELDSGLHYKKATPLPVQDR